MNITFKKAETNDMPEIWDILQEAIARRKKDGSEQWQDGYPNPAILENDIAKDAGVVLIENEVIIGYFTIFINNEPEYENIQGKWLTNGDFIAVHRVALAEKYLGKGLAKIIFNYVEDCALSKNIFSIKADTNFDNKPMLAIFNKRGYTYCGEVYFRGSPRKAFEKVLKAIK